MTSESKTRIRSDVDFERDGKQVTVLRMEHSVTRSAYGVVPIPIAVVKNGRGPSVLLQAGNHGDEYEGQVVLTRLIRALEPGQIRGRLIILPAANLPAALEGTRVSPLDAGNLNRSFPGDPTGTPTQRIAHYIDAVLMPMCQAVFDIHSGGSSLDMVPYLHADMPADAAGRARARAAIDFINAPMTLVYENQGGVIGTLGEAALGRGLLSFSGEFGGGGTVSRRGIAAAERALFRLLAHLGVMELEARWAERSEGRLMRIDADMHVYAFDDGLFEPAKELGDRVVAGEPAGHILFPEAPAREPVPVHFEAAGLLVCKRSMGRVKRGDCLGHLFGDLD